MINLFVIPIPLLITLHAQVIVIIILFASLLLLLDEYIGDGFSKFLVYRLVRVEALREVTDHCFEVVVDHEVGVSKVDSVLGLLVFVVSSVELLILVSRLLSKWRRCQVNVSLLVFVKVLGSKLESHVLG
jgi:hypothetical protein